MVATQIFSKRLLNKPSACKIHTMEYYVMGQNKNVHLCTFITKDIQAIKCKDKLKSSYTFIYT